MDLLGRVEDAFDSCNPSVSQKHYLEISHIVLNLSDFEISPETHSFSLKSLQKVTLRVSGKDSKSGPEDV